LNQSWDNDSIHRLQVTFQFKKWTTDLNISTPHTAGAGGFVPWSGSPASAGNPLGFITTAVNALLPQVDARVLTNNPALQIAAKVIF
jgi:hypothetical protein